MLCSHASIQKHTVTYLNSKVEQRRFKSPKSKKKIHNSILDSFKKQGNQFLPQNGIIIIIDTGNLIFYEWSIKSDGVCILLQNINLKKKSNTNVISRAGKKKNSVPKEKIEKKLNLGNTMISGIFTAL